jgi:hypothetical protein
MELTSEWSWKFATNVKSPIVQIRKIKYETPLNIFQINTGRYNNEKYKYNDNHNDDLGPDPDF